MVSLYVPSLLHFPGEITELAYKGDDGGFRVSSLTHCWLTKIRVVTGMQFLEGSIHTPCPSGSRGDCFLISFQVGWLLWLMAC
jgi:hypothetical protein